MILHTTPPFLIVTITPHLPTSQHLMPHPYRTKLSRHHLAALPASSPFCITIPSTPPESCFLIPKYLRTFLRRDSFSPVVLLPTSCKGCGLQYCNNIQKQCIELVLCDRFCIPITLLKFINQHQTISLLLVAIYSEVFEITYILIQ